MNPLLDLARGPLFAFCFAVMAFGLLRTGLLTLFDLIRAVRNAGDKNVPYATLIKETFLGLIPFRENAVFGAASFLFHVGVVIVPIFLLDHILLWRSGLGISWPSIPKALADGLTLVAIAAGVVLLGYRVFSGKTRAVSGVMDYALLILVIVLFASGFIASRPYNPVPYETSMLVHVLCGDALLLLIPFTRLSHCILYPFLRVGSHVAWRFPSKAGEEINKTLYGEEVRKV